MRSLGVFPRVIKSQNGCPIKALGILMTYNFNIDCMLLYKVIIADILVFKISCHRLILPSQFKKLGRP